MRAGIAMMPLIDDKSLAKPLHGNLICAQQPDKADIAGPAAVKNGARSLSALTRRKTDIEAADTARGALQDVEAVPFGANQPEALRHLTGQTQNLVPVIAR